jgi:hypothetical protein
MCDRHLRVRVAQSLKAAALQIVRIYRHFQLERQIGAKRERPKRRNIDPLNGAQVFCSGGDHARRLRRASAAGRGSGLD